MGTTKARSNKQGVINRNADAAKRAALAVKLRAQKKTFDEIARECGYASAGACRNAIQRELERCMVGNVDELRREELAVLDQLQQEIWSLAIDKENKGRLFAVDRLLVIAERRAKLMGLDTPVKGSEATTTVIIREVPHGYFGEGKQ